MLNSKQIKTLQVQRTTTWSFPFLMQPVICPKCQSENDYHVVVKQFHQHFHHVATCNQCQTVIKNLPQGKPCYVQFGPFKGTLMADMKSKEQLEYMMWMLRKKFNNTTKGQIVAHLKNINADFSETLS